MTNEIVAAESTNNEVTKGMYCSMSAESQQERLAVFDAVSNSGSVDDMIGKNIAVKDVVIQPVDLLDKATGEMRTANRIVLIDENGEAYGCVSQGVETSLKNLIAIVGEPTWEPAINLTPTKKQGSNGYKFTTLALTK